MSVWLFRSGWLWALLIGCAEHENPNRAQDEATDAGRTASRDAAAAPQPKDSGRPQSGQERDAAQPGDAMSGDAGGADAAQGQSACARRAAACESGGNPRALQQALSDAVVSCDARGLRMACGTLLARADAEGCVERVTV